MVTNMRPILFARMNEETVALVKSVSGSRGENLSTFVRRAVLRELARLSYLTPEVKKALEVPTKEVITP